MSRYKVENFYRHIKGETHAHRHYPNQDLINMELPARILCCSPSGTGKTSLILNLIKGINVWHHVIIVAKNLDEPLYKHVIDKYRALEKKHKLAKPILLAIDDLKDLPDIDKDFPANPTENTLAIFDDLICEDKKSLKLLDPWFTRGRKKEVTMCFLSQGYFDVPKLIRKNCNYVMLKKISNPLDLSRILKEYALNCTKDEIHAKYKIAMQGYAEDGEDRAHNAFFMIDALPKHPALQLRSQFNPIE